PAAGPALARYPMLSRGADRARIGLDVPELVPGRRHVEIEVDRYPRGDVDRQLPRAVRRNGVGAGEGAGGTDCAIRAIGGDPAHRARSVEALRTGEGQGRGGAGNLPPIPGEDVLAVQRCVTARVGGR